MDEDDSGEVTYTEFTNQLWKMKNAETTTILAMVKFYVLRISKDMKRLQAGPLTDMGITSSSPDKSMLLTMQDPFAAAVVDVSPSASSNDLLDASRSLGNNKAQQQDAHEIMPQRSTTSNGQACMPHDSMIAAERSHGEKDLPQRQRMSTLKQQGTGNCVSSFPSTSNAEHDGQGTSASSQGMAQSGQLDIDVIDGCVDCEDKQPDQHPRVHPGDSDRGANAAPQASYRDFSSDVLSERGILHQPQRKHHCIDERAFQLFDL
eukprot:gnl/MRDRNA2_/MRDRNA2_245085_c0_seq1.p1 gnl/MRDRNA2_/MRDRNA2_245085_c0~~gnl/MRDRNA2_/MRDRNA2_245085_c0_seq1.p1  ORF type:complete len:278 (-),score=59.64 gnl/MRDRNA2_/MRDRNA2_245085_c0_seq1:188-973(-)